MRRRKRKRKRRRRNEENKQQERRDEGVGRKDVKSGACMQYLRRPTGFPVALLYPTVRPKYSALRIYFDKNVAFLYHCNNCIS
jgi:hypothetical protein